MTEDTEDVEEDLMSIVEARILAVGERCWAAGRDVTAEDVYEGWSRCLKIRAIRYGLLRLAARGLIYEGGRAADVEWHDFWHALDVFTRSDDHRILPLPPKVRWRLARTMFVTGDPYEDADEELAGWLDGREHHRSDIGGKCFLFLRDDEAAVEFRLTFPEATMLVP